MDYIPLLGGFSPTRWKPAPVRTAMRPCLAVFIGDENRLVRLAQVLIGHQIWERDQFSHFEKGPVLMVKNY
jgi:hypothetical protein